MWLFAMGTGRWAVQQQYINEMMAMAQRIERAEVMESLERHCIAQEGS
jgi:hypothetical protein